ncbi:MAG: CHRD domain-containing protein [Azospirillaceae bacterium]|nr:CHRD domain-containing protein [Azospirillaceae bacterium]
MKRRTAVVAAAITAAMMASTGAYAETVSIKTFLDGQTEVPAVTTPATGTADVTIDTEAKKVSWTITYKDLSGTATAAHFHGPAAKGANAGVEIPIPVAASPIEGSATVTDAQLADLLTNKTYINIHSAAHPGGEIRGYLTK